MFVCRVVGISETLTCASSFEDISPYFILDTFKVAGFAKPVSFHCSEKSIASFVRVSFNLSEAICFEDFFTVLLFTKVEVGATKEGLEISFSQEILMFFVCAYPEILHINKPKNKNMCFMSNSNASNIQLV